MNRKPNIYSEVLRFRVEPRDCQRLLDLAQRRRTDTSALLRKALRDFLDNEVAGTVE